MTCIQCEGPGRETGGAARIQNSPERFPVNLYLRFRGPSGKVMVHDAACQPGSSRRCWRLRWHGLIPRGGDRRPALVSRDALRRASLLAHPPGKWWRSFPNVPLLGRIRQFYGPHELERHGRISHADRLSMGAGKSPEETVDDHALRYLGGRGGSVQQPVMREPRELGSLSTGGQSRLVLPLVKLLSRADRG